MSQVVSQLNQIQADANVMFVKAHNYHWNVKGIQFYAIHGMTEGIYNEMATIYDEMAERAIQLGGDAIVTMGEALQISNIQEERKTRFDGREVLEAIVKDFEYFKAQFQKLSAVADAIGDSTTVAIADDKVAHFEKEIWMLNASLA